ncbi:leucine-rich repeat protein [Streptococcus suis]
MVIPEGVTEIESNAFSGSSLREVVFPSTLTKIGSGAFSGTSLTTISLPSSVTTIESSAFSGTQLTTVTLPSGLIHLGDYAFGNISSLTSINIPKDINSDRNYYTYNSPFSGSSNLAQISFDEGITVIPDYLFKDLSGLVGITLPNTVTRIGSQAFSNAGLTEVVLPERLTRIENSAFSGTGLTEVVIPAGVTHIGYNAFDIDSLTKVTLPSSLESASSAFAGSPNLKEVVLTGSWTKIPSGLFTGTGIERLVIPEGVTAIGNSAFAYTNIADITLPTSLERIGSSAFSNTKLSSVIVPDNVKTIGSYAFSNTPLELVVLPREMTDLGSGAFSSTKLSILEIPEGITNIDDSLYAGNEQLKRVYLPKSLTSFSRQRDWLIIDEEPEENIEYYVYIDSYALEYMIENQVPFKLRDEGVSSDDSKLLDTGNSFYLATSSSSRREGYLGLDLKYSLKDGKASDDGTYKLRLNIPTTTSLYNGTVRLDGQDIPVTLENGYINLPVTEREGSLKLTLKANNNDLTNVQLFAQLAYEKDGRKTAETIGAVNVVVPVLQVTTNAVTSRPYARITGIADPADSLVAYLDGVEVGSIKVKKDGTYQLDVPFTTLENNKEYLIRVEATSPDGQGLTASTTVRYEEGLPELENFIMRHNGYEYNLKEHGDKVPTIVFRPGAEFEFEVDYSNAEKIRSVIVTSEREGIVKQIELEFQPDKSKFIYRGVFDEHNPSYVFGKLSLHSVLFVTNKDASENSSFVSSKVIESSQTESSRMEKVLTDIAEVTILISTGTEDFEYEYIGILIPSKKNLLQDSPVTRSANVNKPLTKEDLDVCLPQTNNTIYDSNLFKRRGGSTFGSWIEFENLVNYKGIYIGRPNDPTNHYKQLFRSSESIPKNFEDYRKFVEKVGDLYTKFDDGREFIVGVKEFRDGRNISLGTQFKKINIKPGSNNVFVSAFTKPISAIMTSVEMVNTGKLIDELDFYLVEGQKIPMSEGDREVYEGNINVLRAYVATKAATIPLSFIPGVSIISLPATMELEKEIDKLRNNVKINLDTLRKRYASKMNSKNIATPNVIIDPSGIITNADSNLPVRGATTTVYYRGENGEEVLWDAGEYSQLNPLSTTVNGEYAWDVPEGYWKVKVEKEGYESAESEWLPVPPPQTEVHFKLKPHAYTIAYNVGEGSMPTTGLVTTYKTDVAVALPQPTRKGYKFAGWFEDSSLTGVTYLDTLFLKPGDKTLFAKWERATKLLGTEAEDAFIHLRGDDVDKVARLVKAEQAVSTLAVDLPEGVQESDVQLLTIQLLDAEGQAVSLTEPARMEIGLETERPPMKVLTYNNQDNRFEEVVFDWDGDLKELQFDLQDTVNYLIVYQPLSVITTRTRQEVRVLTTDHVLELEDSELAQGHTREEASINGQVLVEITETLTDGQITASSERELSRTEATPRKVYRGTKVVSVTPVITTRTRQEVRVLTTEQVLELEDSDLAQGHTREEASINGQVVVEIIETLTNGQVTASSEREISRTEAIPRKLYRGTMVVQIPTVAPTAVALPTVQLTRVERPIKSVEVIYLEDANLLVGESREEIGQDGVLVVEVAEFVLDGQVTSSSEREISRTEATPRKVYRGTKVVSVTPVITTRTRQEVHVLTTEQVLELEDSELAQGQTREEASINGQVLVEITETLTDGQVTSSSERELSRTEATPRKVYRGTKVVSVTPVITTRTRQEVHVLTTEQVLELEDSELAQGQTREEASINGQVLVEITETLTDGQVTSSSEREISRTAAVPRKVYRGTKIIEAPLVAQLPAVAPTAVTLPTVKLTRVERPIKSETVVYLEDPTLPVGEIRVEEGLAGLLVVDLAEYVLDGQIVKVEEFILSHQEATPRKIYRGRKQERRAVATEQTQAVHLPSAEEGAVNSQSLPNTGQTDSVYPAILGLSLFLAGTALIKSKKDETV